MVLSDRELPSRLQNSPGTTQTTIRVQPFTLCPPSKSAIIWPVSITKFPCLAIIRSGPLDAHSIKSYTLD